MKYSNPYIITGILVLFLIGFSYNTNGQTVPIANRVVINEVELNPIGDDSQYPLQWVELYNPTNNTINIGGWTIGATSGLKQTYTIPSGTLMSSHQFVVYHYVALWFPHGGVVVQLKTPDDDIIDQTPPLSDQQGDGTTWQRIYDGYDTGSPFDWILKSGTPGFSNGSPPKITVSNPLTLYVSTDAKNYVFGDVVTIEGQVSKLVVNSATPLIPQPVNLILSGPHGLHKTFALFPGNDLKFSTSTKLDQVLGFTGGTYTISVSYGDTVTSSSFSLGSEIVIVPTVEAPATMYVTTDSSTYTISKPVVLQGVVSKVIPLTPLKYKVYDPTNVVIYEGSLFPDAQGKLTTVNQYQRSQGGSGLYVNSVNPIYGIYRIAATYADISNFTTFTLVPEQVQTSGVLVSTDKRAYAPGETVVISGSTKLSGLQNTGLNPSLQIIQTSTTGSSGTQTSGNRGIVVNTANIRTIVNLQSDNTFSYKFALRGTLESLGNYRAIVTLTNAIAEVDFAVVQNPSTYNATISSSPFSIVTDKSSYALGDHIIIRGMILNPIQLSTQNAGANVRILILNSTGAPLTSGGTFINNIFVPTDTSQYYFAFPDANGQFQVEQIIHTGLYKPGIYTLKATYNNLSTATTFTVYNPLETSLVNQIVASTDKKVYDVGNTVQLNGKVSAAAGDDSFTLTLVKPSGSQITFPLKANNGIFSWTWTIPKTDASGSIIWSTDRSSSSVLDPTIAVYGIYRIKINSAQASSDIFFQVSKNPQPNQDMSPVVIQTDKMDYLSTDVARIWGEVIPTQNAATREANAVVQVLIYTYDGQQIYRGDATVNQGGQYFITIPFHTGVWKSGAYKVYAQYSGNKVITSFKVTDPFTKSSDKLQLYITTDTDQYIPGQTVLITGRTSSIVSINEGVGLAFGLTNDTVIREGEAYSKKGIALVKSTVSFDQYGSFSYDYKIPNNTPLGNYIIIAQVPFGYYNTHFNVVNQLPVQNIPVPVNETQTTPTANGTKGPSIPTVIPSTVGPVQKHVKSVNTLVEKIGKISDSVIPIIFAIQPTDNMTYYPRELDGLLRVNPGNENDVSIKVSSQDGTCVIGPDTKCLVTKSTIQSGMQYQIVSIDGVDFLVGYSGTGIRLQQFSIIPANANDVIPEGQWNVDVLKKDQVTKFYYQVTYVGK